MGSVLEFPEPYADDRLLLDFHQRLVVLDNQRLSLRRKEFDLLAVLVQHAAETVGRSELLRHVWDYGAEIRTRTLDVHIRRLRKQLGVPGERHIETIFGVGYRFQPFQAGKYHTAPDLPA